MTRSLQRIAGQSPYVASTNAPRLERRLLGRPWVCARCASSLLRRQERLPWADAVVSARNRGASMLSSRQQRFASSFPRLKATIITAMRDNDHFALVSALGEVVAEPGAAQNIAYPTWIEILRCLDPRNFLHWMHKDGHRHMISSKTAQINPSASSARKDYHGILIEVYGIFCSRDMPLVVQEYRLFLQHFSRLNAADQAQAVWDDMNAAGVKPDVDCFNHYMSAILWDFKSRQRHESTFSTRVSPPRVTDTTFFSSEPVQQIRTVRAEMTRHGVTPDLQTWRIILTALSRAGAYPDVVELLRTTVGIDVAAIQNGYDSESDNAQMLVQGGRGFLYTIADVFGNLDDIATGIRVIDHISHKRGIEVTQNVWYRLMQWTWMRSRIRQGNDDHARFGEAASRIQHLARLMQGDLYKTLPSTDMRDLLIRAHNLVPVEETLQDRIANVMRNLARGEQDVIRRVNHARRLGRALLNATTSGRPLAAARKRFNDAVYQKRIAQTLMHRWVRELIPVEGKRHPLGPPSRTYYFWRATGQMPAWAHWRVTGLLDMFKEWARFLPPTVEYSITTGVVELQLKGGWDADVRARPRRPEITVPGAAAPISPRRTRMVMPRRGRLGRALARAEAGEGNGA